MKLTKAQVEFLSSIKAHVNYRTIGRYARTAKQLEAMGYVEIFQIFARITPAGLAALDKERG